MPFALSRSQLGLIMATLAAGAWLRFAWLGDIEYKYDEHWMFTHSLAAARGGPWPWLGMPSSVGTPNPGMSVWVFVLLQWGVQWICGTPTPIGLSAAVAALGFVAELGLLAWVLKRMPRGEPGAEREVWLWGWALSSVAFNSIQWQRKIWTLSVLPIFMVAALWGWSRRERPWGSLVWAAVAACLGQIHMPGFFLAIAWGLWALARPSDRRQVRWAWAIAGAVAAAWPLIPWLEELARLRAAQPGGAGGWSWSLEEILQLKFWLYWLTEAVGIQQPFVLGRKAFWDWVMRPWVLPLWVFAASAALGGAGLSVARAFRGKRGGAVTAPSSARDLARMGGGLFGGLLTATSIPIHRHYLGTAFPLAYVWIASAWLRGWPRRGPAVLAALWVSMAILSASFLHYIHVNGGAPGADYGVSYSRAYPQGVHP